MAYPPGAAPPMAYPPQRPEPPSNMMPAGPGTVPPPGANPHYQRRGTVQFSTDQEFEALTSNPTENKYPCGCPYPGAHNTDCMWSMWEQMRDNYMQTKMLMTQFMSQMSPEQFATATQPGGQNQQGGCCRQSCCQMCSNVHGQGQASNTPQMSLESTFPWLQSFGSNSGSLGLPASLVPGDPEFDKSEHTKLIEEQKRIKSFWAQFLNIFDMALDLANDVSKDRKKAINLRKEKEKLEKHQQQEELRKQRRQRQLQEPAKPKSEEKESKEKSPQKKDEKKEDKKEDKKDPVKSDGKESTPQKKDEKKEDKKDPVKSDGKKSIDSFIWNFTDPNEGAEKEKKGSAKKDSEKPATTPAKPSKDEEDSGEAGATPRAKPSRDEDSGEQANPPQVEEQGEEESQEKTDDQPPE